jgi:hypothetical protein
MLALPITFQKLQAIARRRAQIAQEDRRVEHVEFAFRHVGDRAPLSRGSSPAKERFGFLVGEAGYHGALVCDTLRVFVNQGRRRLSDDGAGVDDASRQIALARIGTRGQTHPSRPK